MLLRSGCYARRIFTSRTVMLAASHGHVSVLRLRASANSKHDALPGCFLPRRRKRKRVYCQRETLPVCFSRVAQSCSLLEMGTIPFLVSERLRIASTASVKHCQSSFPRTTLYARPHHGAMACGPVDACSCFCEALNWELRTPVCVANETLHRRFTLD